MLIEYVARGKALSSENKQPDRVQRSSQWFKKFSSSYDLRRPINKEATFSTSIEKASWVLLTCTIHMFPYKYVPLYICSTIHSSH